MIYRFILLTLTITIFLSPSMVFARDKAEIKDTQTYLAGAEFGCSMSITKKHPDYPNIAEQTLNTINEDCKCLVQKTYILYGVEKVEYVLKDPELFSKIVPVCQKEGHLKHLKKQ